MHGEGQKPDSYDVERWTYLIPFDHDIDWDLIFFHKVACLLYVLDYIIRVISLFLVAGVYYKCDFLIFMLV